MSTDFGESYLKSSRTKVYDSLLRFLTCLHILSGHSMHRLCFMKNYRNSNAVRPSPQNFSAMLDEVTLF